MPHPLDNNILKQSILPFRQALQGGVSKRLSWKSGRFSTKAYARCNTTNGLFLRNNVTDKGKPKIALIVDCSGSMSGRPIYYAAHLCYILNVLHRSNNIDARIICSGAHRGSFKVPLPVPDEMWSYLQAEHGTEYLSQTFHAHRQEIVNCDLVACYTDADISDGALKPSLWRSHGKSCVGLYCGHKRQAEVMRRYFDYSIARTDVRDLFLEYLRLVKRLMGGDI